ncbi:protein Star-like isoform X2 [Macrobrachium rosenbergii]|uniref:protein Star-like isoform X2 n=1 Tax=Macrobrachium rosenbergii TaxID=79674 RepID=UPI0034D5BE73
MPSQTRRIFGRLNFHKKVSVLVICGIVGPCSIFSALLHTTLLSYYCQEECSIRLWADPIPPEDSHIVSFVRRNVLDAPQEHVLYPVTKKDLEDVSWKKVNEWYLILAVIQRTFANLRGGIFVEVGAADGVFLSLTSWLEEEMNWSGLLIEPRLEAYQEMRRRRKAAAAQVCVSDANYNKKEKFWQPKETDYIQSTFQKIAEGKSTLLQYVAEEDQALGKISSVPCFTLDALLLAANINNTKRIDFLVIHTMGGEVEILDTLTRREILMLLVHTRQKHKAVLNARKLNLKLYDEVPNGISDFYFFINLKVDIVKQKKPQI